MPRIVLLAGLFVMLALVPARAGYDDAIKYYDHGDYAAALRELRPLAAQGNLDAQAKLGAMYLDGRGVKQDYTTAMRWLKQAATEGNVAAAESDIGRIYYNGAGAGLKRDYAEAARWFQKAADQGYSDAQVGLGTLYEYGLGVPKDYIKAYMLFELASNGGSKDATRLRDEIGRVMRPNDVAQAEKLVAAWQPKPAE
jgi:TPR repeat protein